MLHSRQSATPERRYPWLLVALAVAMGIALPGIAGAAQYSIGPGDVPALIMAITDANGNGEANTIDLAPGSVYTLTAADNDTGGAGPNGLPAIVGNITINGHGATIQRSTVAGTPEFRILRVDPIGTLTLQQVTLRNGHAFGFGGGVLNRGTTTIDSSTLAGSLAGSGGAVSNLGFDHGPATLTIIDSTLSGNRALFGGAIDNFGGENQPGGTPTTASLVRSTLSGNSAEQSGGGLNNGGGTVAIANSTLSGNSATFFGGGVGNFDSMTITNSTVSHNSADDGGGIGDRTALVITNSIVANSVSGGDCINLGSGLVPNGANLATDGTCAGFSQVTPAQLNLGPLLDNGGPTPTHALLSGSVAIDTGDQAQCVENGITTDQRGRLRDGHCDIGAYEFGATTRADLLIAQGVDRTSVKSGDVVTYFITVHNFGPDTARGVVASETLSSGTTFVGARASRGTFTAPPVGQTGTVTWFVGDLLDGSGEAAEIAVTVIVRGKTTITSTATVTSDTPDPNEPNNTASITVSVAGGGGAKKK